MRYLVQVLIPALIVAGVIYAVSRSRGQTPPADRSQRDALLSTPGFVLILVVGAVFTVALVFGMGA